MSEPGSSPSGLHPQATQKAESGPGPGRRTRFTPAKPSWPSQARGRKRDGSSGREAASAKPRCLRHPKTRPACAATHRTAPRRHPARPSSPPPAADRRSCGGQAGHKQRKRGVSPGRMSRPCSRAQPGGRKRECTSERSQDGEANARLIGLGSPRAAPNARRIGFGSPRATHLPHHFRPTKSVTPGQPPPVPPAVMPRNPRETAALQSPAETSPTRHTICSHSR